MKELIKNTEVVNSEDKGYTDGNAFLLAIGSYGEHQFIVYARYLQESLEILGEYCKQKEYFGLIETDYNKLMELYDNNEDYIDENYFAVNGGEFYLRMPGYVQEISL